MCLAGDLIIFDSTGRRVLKKISDVPFLPFVKKKINFILEDPRVLVGLFVGGIIAYYFAALSMEAVGKAASKVVEEIKAAGGEAVPNFDNVATVESVKAVGEVYAPVTGEVVEVNGALEGRPELVNEAPFGDGWLVKVRVSDPGELDGLLGVEEYRDLVAELEGS